MLNTSPGIGGERGRGLDQTSVLLEISRRPIEKTEYCLSVLWHEIVQGCYVPLYFRPLLFKIFSDEKLVGFVEEINIRSLFPIGIFSIRFFHGLLPVTLTSFLFQAIPQVTPRQTIEIINLAVRHIKEERCFDVRYIENLIKILKRSKKWAILLR